MSLKPIKLMVICTVFIFSNAKLVTRNLLSHFGDSFMVTLDGIMVTQLTRQLLQVLCI